MWFILRFGVIVVVAAHHQMCFVLCSCLWQKIGATDFMARHEHTQMHTHTVTHTYMYRHKHRHETHRAIDRT